MTVMNPVSDTINRNFPSGDQPKQAGQESNEKLFKTV